MNDAASQRGRLLERLKKGPITILEARRELDILAPAPRVFELRHLFGQNIETHRVIQLTEAGKPHRIALYVLTQN